MSTTYNGRFGKMYHLADTPLGGGGEGAIYDIDGEPGHVAKVFKLEKRTTERERKLRAMVELESPPEQIEQYAWPLDILYEKGHFVGYVMPKITGQRLRNVYVYDQRESKSWAFYIAVAKNLAAAVHNVHEVHQVIGDLNPENILVDKQGIVTLIDVDSFHITAGDSVYRCGVGMPEFVAPELQGIHFPSAPLPTFTVESDRFSLAVLLFSLLMGAHPFSCKVVGSASASQFQPLDNMKAGRCAFFGCPGLTIPLYSPEIDCLPPYVQKLFRRAFVSGIGTPALRPSAEEWHHALTRLENELRTCNTDPTHIYYSGAKECPWCVIGKKMQRIPKEPVRPATRPFRPAEENNNCQAGPSAYQYVPAKKNLCVKKHHWPGYAVAALILLFLVSFFAGGEQELEAEPPVSEEPYEEFGSEYTEMTIPEIEESTLYIDPITQSYTWKNGAEIEKWTGELTYDGQEDYYSFTAQETGSCRINIDNLRSESAVHIDVLDDASGEELKSSYCTNGSGVTIDSSAGEKYTVRVRQYNGLSSYDLSISHPKKTTDVTGESNVIDSVEFKDQKNTYLFTAPRDGRYRFEMSDMQDGTAVYLYLFNNLGEEVNSAYCLNGSGITVDCTGGETYTLQVQQYEGFSSYDMDIGCQKAVTDISELTTVYDNVEFKDQRNVYAFTAARDGIWQFEVSDMVNGTAVYLYLFNDLGEEVNSAYCLNGSGIIMDCIEGETYILQVRQYSLFSSYTLSVRQPKEVISAGCDTILHDTIQYDDQENRYLIQADDTGDITLTLSDMVGGTVDLSAYDGLDYELLGKVPCRNGDTVTIRDISAGDEFQLRVSESEGLSSYTLRIE